MSPNTSSHVSDKLPCWQLPFRLRHDPMSGNHRIIPNSVVINESLTAKTEVVHVSLIHLIINWESKVRKWKLYLFLNYLFMNVADFWFYAQIKNRELNRVRAAPLNYTLFAGGLSLGKSEWKGWLSEERAVLWLCVKPIIIIIKKKTLN